MSCRKSNHPRWDGIPGQPVLPEPEWRAICQSVVCARESAPNKGLSELKKRIEKIEQSASEEFDARLLSRPTQTERRAIPAAWLILDRSDVEAKIRENTQDSERRRLAEQNALLSRLQVEWSRDLNSQEAQEIIEAAAKLNDHGFFVRLGKCLELAALSREDFSLPKLADLLLREWVSRAPRRPGYSHSQLPHYPRVPERIGLCFFTNPALADYCRLTESINLSDDAVIKCHSRLLKLRPAKKKLVWGVKRVGKVLHYS